MVATKKEEFVSAWREELRQLQKLTYSLNHEDSKVVLECIEKIRPFINIAAENVYGGQDATAKNQA